MVGQSLPDLPTASGWLVEQVQGQFTLLTADENNWPDINGIRIVRLPKSDHALERYGAQGAYLIRPDGHICAHFNAPDQPALAAALARAQGNTI